MLNNIFILVDFTGEQGSEKPFGFFLLFIDFTCRTNTETVNDVPSIIGIIFGEKKVDAFTFRVRKSKSPVIRQ
jgi:hypothetical protein